MLLLIQKEDLRQFFYLDLSEMDPVPGADLDFPDANDLLHFNVSVTPSDGLYRGATFTFAVEVPANYPYEPPKVACQTLVRTKASVSLHIKFKLYDIIRSIIQISTGRDMCASTSCGQTGCPCSVWVLSYLGS